MLTKEQIKIALTDGKMIRTSTLFASSYSENMVNVTCSDQECDCIRETIPFEEFLDDYFSWGPWEIIN